VRRLFRVNSVILLFLITLVAPLQASPLSQKIETILKKHQLQSTPVSIQIVDLMDGSSLIKKNENQLLIPASLVKLAVAATAASTLGPQYTFPTEFYSQGGIRRGVIQDLWVKGYGDPFFVTEELERLVEQFKKTNLREVQGNLYVDDTYFDQEDLLTYLSTDTGKVYRVLTGSLSFNLLGEGLRDWFDVKEVVK